MNPVTTGGMLYPSFSSPRTKDFVCPTCHSTNRSHVTSVVFNSDTVQELNRALEEWNDWVFKEGITGVLKGQRKIEGFNFRCGWCGAGWYVASDLILNNILSDQINHIYSFTKKTGKEFGALILRTSRGLILDMVQVGEETYVQFNLTRKLESDEEILGSLHVHPYSDDYSKWDLSTFCANDWEKICMLVGAEGTLWIAVKTAETLKISSEELETKTEEWEDTKISSEEISKRMNFILYKGTTSDLTQMSGKNEKSSLEVITKKIKGSKNL
jgi:hypothetical protein